MLYDPKWEKPEVKADPYSLDTLIAWLEQQPADKEYCFIRARECLIAQYLQAHGVEDYIMRPSEIWAVGWMDIVNPGRDLPNGDTFGLALYRARVVKARRA